MKNSTWSLLKKRLTKTVALALAGAMIIGSTVSAKALTLKDTFDAKYYSETYRDLSNAFGTDAEALYNHYLEYGQKEGRVFSTLIDLKKYREANADLNAAFGDNWNAYLEHYFQYGYAEGRESFGSFDAKAYADRYADLKAAFGYDLEKLYRHYMEYGQKEGRNALKAVEVTSSVTAPTQSVVTPEPEVRPVVRTVGVLVDPETQAPVAHATIRFTKVSDVFTPMAEVEEEATEEAPEEEATVSDGDAEVEEEIVPGVIVGDDYYEVTTDENGQYEVPEFDTGVYSVQATAPNYMTLTLGTIAIETTAETFNMPTFELLSADITGTNTVSGQAIDATTGAVMSNVVIKVRSDWNNYEGAVVTETATDAQGVYSIELERGYYTLEFCMDGYVSVFVNVFSSNATRQFNGTLNPSVSTVLDSEFRVVLTWGERPSDLDSHLVGAREEGEGYYHVYFGDKVYYGLNDEVSASLDVDDTSSYGPETVTVFNVDTEHNYYYSVHDYTNRNNSESTMMSESGAIVRVYQGSALVKEYYVPVAQAGFVWNVFSIVNGEIVDINSINSVYDSMYGAYRTAAE